MYLALDVETSHCESPLPWNPQAYLSTVCAVTSEGETHTFVFRHIEQQGETERDTITRLQKLIDSATTIIGHNLKFDLNWIHSVGITFEGKRLFCTMVAEYLLSAQQAKMASLDSLSEKYLGEKKLDVVATEYWAKGIDTEFVPLKTLLEYNIKDCDLTLRIAEHQINLLRADSMLKLSKVKMAEIHALCEIERTGLRLNEQKRVELEDEYTQRLGEIESRVASLVKRKSLDLSSPAKVSVILFGGTYKVEGTEYYIKVLKDGTAKLKNRKHDYPIRFGGIGFKPVQGSETKKPGVYSTETAVLAQLRHQAKTEIQKEILSLLLERSAIAQILKTYVVGFKEKHFEGVIHCQMNQTITATGRFSSSKPNLQNVATRGEGARVREMLLPHRDVFVEGDLSQLEWVGAAYLSQCPVMLKGIREGIDQHAKTGRDFFNGAGVRTDWKIFNFRMIYGGSPFSFYADPKMPAFSLKRWKQIVANFYEEYHGLKKWQDQNVQTVLRNKGRLSNPTGRRFQFTPVRGKYGLEYRRPQICNYPVQSFATADLVPICMIEIRNRLLHLAPDAVMCNQIHDSIMYDTKEEHVDEIVATMLTVFEEVPSLMKEYFDIDMNVPMHGECKVGTPWRNMKDYTG